MSLQESTNTLSLYMLPETPRHQVSSQLLSCNNGKKDMYESDIDCGGSCPKPCGYGDVCAVAQDCATHYCVSYSG